MDIKKFSEYSINENVFSGKYSNTIRAYYRFLIYEKQDKKNANTVMFGMYAATGNEKGLNGELRMYWENLQGNLTARLSAYEDSWDVLYSVADVLEELAKVNGKNINQKEFVKLLEKCGFQDWSLANIPDFHSNDELLSYYSEGCKFYFEVYENYKNRRELFNSSEFQLKYLKARPEDLEMFILIEKKYPEFLTQETIKKYNLEDRKKSIGWGLEL